MQKKIDHPLPDNYFVNMEKLVFEWDDLKAKENIKGHGVTYEEAQSVFFDDMALQFWDGTRSNQEERFLLLGLSNNLRLLIVVHCFCEKDSTTRIFSARKATRNERKHYPGG